MKAVMPSQLHQLDARVRQLQEAFDIQEKRIAQMQAELDTLPEARMRRRSLRRSLHTQLESEPSHNGNGRRNA